ncbi:MAG: T9SS type A sorting domain-containing protein [Bacteroidota bacterium]|nr:T9SS type A sorting domain-containing protein [Bacteroidota bacterium]
MKKIVLTFFISFLVVSNSFSQYNSPESITYDSTSKRYLISNTASQKIVQRDINGVITDFVTVGGGIHGVTVYNNKVYVCNGTRIKGYDLTNAAEIINVTITGSSFLNDLAIDNTGMMYISDFSGRRIYKLNTNTQEFWIFVPNTTSTPNGVYVDAARNRLLICCWGGSAPVRSVNFSDSVITTLVTTPYSNCDGISLDRYDNVYISTWGIQSVVKYDINFANAPVPVIGSLSNPADIYVNKETDTLAIPNAGNNTVVFHFLDNPVGINHVSNNTPSSFELYQNFPNPFNPNTIIKYNLPAANFVTLKIYDALGKEVIALVNEKQNSGTYEVNFNASGLFSGIYFYKLEAVDLESGSGKIHSDIKKMVLVK